MRSLLEGTGSDLMDAIKGFMSTVDQKNKNNNTSKSYYLNGSISNATKNLVMTFPMLCDNSLPPATASMLSRANERNIVTMLQMLFASMQLNGKTGQEVLAMIHKNINTNMSMDDAIDALDNYIDKNNLNESVLTKAELNTAIRVMTEQLKTPQKSFPVNSFSERSLNGYSVCSNMYGRTIIREDIYKTDDEIDAMDPDEIDAYNKKLKATQMRNGLDDAESERKNNTDGTKAQMDRNKIDSDMSDILSRQLLDTDVKKANEMQPTLMVVRFNELDPDGKIYSQKPFLAGVKSRLIPVDSVDIIERMVSKNKTKVNFLNFIRATTGEIKFFKDFVFCVDQNKLDAKNAAKKGDAANMWKVLENRSTKNFINKNKRKGNDASAITTLALNQETVNILKKEYDFDIEKIANARMILDAYNLLGLIICDESVEVVKILYAGNDSFEQQAYSYLEKESNDNSYKKVINLIGKMNGR